INRSPFSYLQNPDSERRRYSSNTDKEMMVLKMVADNGQEIGMFSWFAIHPVSMKNEGYLPGKGPYVAAFAASNLGDVSPNTKGPHCINTGEPCENMGSYCPIGGAKMCIATGPGEDMFQSTQIIGRQIYLKAKDIYMKASKEIDGPISSAHQWVDMSNITVQLNSTHTGKTCKAALGYSFAAGTIDGPGMFNFTQGTVEGHPFWDAVRDALLVQPSDESVECQKPKPILLPTGELTKPYPWHPDIIDVQMVTIGSAAIVALPGEFTTMAGRRVREAVKKEFEIQGKAGMDIILSGLCNIYTHYIVTYEEYQVQRYEGASTIFGPHTLSAYIQLFQGLAKAIATGTTQDLPNLPEPPCLNITNLNLLPLIFDAKPLGWKYGDVLQDVRPTYKAEFEIQGKAGMDIILSGLCNIYTHYIVTYEEYQVQRYEGASTIFGPHTLSAYIQLFQGLAKAIATGTTQDLPNLPEPPCLNITNLNLLPLIFDAKPLGWKYGDVLQDVRPTYKAGEAAEVHFIGANPRNSAKNMTTFTFLTVEKYHNVSKSWQVLQDDASWDTRFIWRKGMRGQSTSIIEWLIPKTTESGKYRMQYFGHSKEFLSSVQAFNGTSSTFEVSN
ncbi:putative neutral ceramidase C, partial [Python bivittatus]|uniref:Neutral ceramidase n=1 Tax=Python bivittatus TaxID=176946 RepID=A0A9F2WM49_PYTBI